MKTQVPVRTPDRLRERLIWLHDTQHIKWRDMAEMPEFRGVAPGTLCAIARSNYEPKREDLRRKLGLPELITIEVHRDPKGRFT